MRKLLLGSVCAAALFFGNWHMDATSVIACPMFMYYAAAGSVPFSVTDAGNGESAVAALTVSTGATVTASVGDWLVVVVAASNDQTGGASSITAPSDAAGNTYTERATVNYDPGTVNAGATLGIYTATITNALSGDVVTANFSSATPQKSVQVYRCQPGTGQTISFIAADTVGSTGAATTHSAATVSVTSGDVIFGCASIETNDPITGDSDTMNGSWSSVLTIVADGGSDPAAMSCVSQHKIVNATGNQSWECTTGAVMDGARSYLVLRSA